MFTRPPAGHFSAGNSQTLSVTFNPTDSTDYNSVTTTASINVDKKALTVTGSTAAAKVYDGTTAEPLGGTAAFLPAEALGSGSPSDGKPYTGDTITIGGTATGTFAAKDVGTALAVTVTGVTVGGANSSNYTVTQQTGLTANITPKALTVTGLTAAAKVYDGTTAEPLGGTAAF